MIKTTKIRTAEENLTVILEQRLKTLEVEMMDAKKFSHLSSDAMELMQQQINELRETLEHLIFIIHKETVSQKNFVAYQNKIGLDYC